jgi:hypothetical protein
LSYEEGSKGWRLLARSPVTGAWHFMLIHRLSLIALAIAGVIE